MFFLTCSVLVSLCCTTSNSPFGVVSTSASRIMNHKSAFASSKCSRVRAIWNERILSILDPGAKKFAFFCLISNTYSLYCLSSNSLYANVSDSKARPINFIVHHYQQFYMLRCGSLRVIFYWQRQRPIYTHVIKWIPCLIREKIRKGGIYSKETRHSVDRNYTTIVAPHVCFTQHEWFTQHVWFT